MAWSGLFGKRDKPEAKGDVSPAKMFADALKDNGLDARSIAKTHYPIDHAYWDDVAGAVWAKYGVGSTSRVDWSTHRYGKELLRLKPEFGEIQDGEKKPKIDMLVKDVQDQTIKAGYAVELYVGRTKENAASFDELRRALCDATGVVSERDGYAHDNQRYGVKLNSDLPLSEQPDLSIEFCGLRPIDGAGPIHGRRPKMLRKDELSVVIRSHDQRALADFINDQVLGEDHLKSRPAAPSSGPNLGK